jgi:hypothetical protein
MLREYIKAIAILRLAANCRLDLVDLIAQGFEPDTILRRVTQSLREEREQIRFKAIRIAETLKHHECLDARTARVLSELFSINTQLSWQERCAVLGVILRMAGQTEAKIGHVLPNDVYDMALELTERVCALEPKMKRAEALGLNV